MKRMLSLCAVGFVMLTGAVRAYGDLAPRPSSSPTPAKQGKVVLHTGLTVVPDPSVSEARLQISQETLGYLRSALANAPQSHSMIERITHSSTRTIIAGLFLFLSVSFAGVWLARSGQRRTHKAATVFLLGAAVLGAAAIITRANAGPPGYVRWGNLPQALSEGRATQGGLDIEITGEGSGMKLIVPIRKR